MPPRELMGPAGGNKLTLTKITDACANPKQRNRSNAKVTVFDGDNGDLDMHGKVIERKMVRDLWEVKNGTRVSLTSSLRFSSSSFAVTEA